MVSWFQNRRFREKKVEGGLTPWNDSCYSPSDEGRKFAPFGFVVITAPPPRVRARHFNRAQGSALGLLVNFHLIWLTNPLALSASRVFTSENEKITRKNHVSNGVWVEVHSALREWSHPTVEVEVFAPKKGIPFRLSSSSEEVPISH